MSAARTSEVGLLQARMVQVIPPAFVPGSGGGRKPCAGDPSRVAADGCEGPARRAKGPAVRTLAEILGEVEHEAIASALARNGGNISRTARELGVGIGIRSSENGGR
jgi:DNA-binding NtrC family response regulator